jgi:hypothetical protein
VFGGYRLNAKQVPEKLNPDFDDGTLCKKSGSCIGGTCVGKDFPAVRACLVTAGPLRSARQCLEAPGGGIPARLMAAHLPFLLPPPPPRSPPGYCCNKDGTCPTSSCVANQLGTEERK